MADENKSAPDGAGKTGSAADRNGDNKTDQNQSGTDDRRSENKQG